MPSRTVKFETIFEKISYPSDFENSHENFQLLENIKPTRNLFCTNIYNIFINNYRNKFRKKSCGFYIFDKLKNFRTIFKITMVGCFFQKWSPTSAS